MRVLIALLLLLCVAVAIRADDAAGPGLDLLLLVDRSNSMSSHAPVATAEALPLALNVIAWSARSARVSHRFGVVSFGSSTQTDVPLTFVDPHNLPLLRNQISALPSRSLGHTNLADAFETAMETFRALPADARRRRAILLLTDGHADVPGVPERVSVQAIDRIIAAELAPPNTSIDVLLFGGRETVPWSRIARERVHRVQSDREELLATFHRVVSDLAGVRNTQQEIAGVSDTIVLPPYLDYIVFDIFRGDSAGSVSVLPPDSSAPVTSKTPGVEEVHAGDRVSTIVIKRPAAGAWVFRKSHPRARVSVLSQQFFPRGALVQPSAQPPVRKNEEVAIGYRLNDGEGRPLQELAGYPLSVDVSIVMPDGQSVVLPMTRDAAVVPAIYRTRPTECRAAGRYWTEVMVTTADRNGRPVRVFEDHWSGFTVHEAERQRVASAALHRMDAEPLTRFGSMRPLFLAIAIIVVPAIALLVLAIRRR